MNNTDLMRRIRLARFNLYYGWPGEFLMNTYREDYTELSDPDKVIMPERIQDYDLQTFAEFVDRILLIKEQLNEERMVQDHWTNY